jgi:hypothetical protein
MRRPTNVSFQPQLRGSATVIVAVRRDVKAAVDADVFWVS